MSEEIKMIDGGEIGDTVIIAEKEAPKAKPSQEDIDRLLGIPIENSEDKKAPEPGSAENIQDVLDGMGTGDFFDNDGNPKPQAKDSMDSELVGEFAIEIMDLALGFGARAIAGDWSEENEKKYEISDRKKNQLRKPLTKILERRGAKVSPELLFMVMIIAIYFPMYYAAYKEKRKKMDAEKPKMSVKNPLHESIKRAVASLSKVPGVEDVDPITPQEAGIPEKEVNWLRKNEAATMVGVSLKTIANWGAQGNIVRKLIKKNKVSEWYYSEKSVRAYALQARNREKGSGRKPQKAAPVDLFNDRNYKLIG